MSETIVEARRLTKNYGAVRAVRGIDFDIRRQECFGFLGVNGAGKTTTMKMVYCRIGATSGTLRVVDLDAASHSAEIRRRLGVVTQANALDPELSVLDNLLTYASFFDIPAARCKAKSENALALLNLSGRTRDRVRDLSGGMQRRLVIAKALVTDPELLILDEPTTGLDPQARLLVWETLAALKRSGLTIVLTTHYMDEAARLCDRIAIMDEGRIFALGTPAELIAAYAAPDVLEVSGADGAALAAAAGGLLVRRERLGATDYLYTLDNGALLRALTAHGIELQRHVARPATLEDVFLNITGRELRD
ncbi:MAG TPA: ABC transporter ATP-binding protein [Candidatus Eremiobacteraceae bacterium]|nr:ABC transporter ATP-binding protein [Candidatus Eremiobacteraceae bacterium]